MKFLMITLTTMLYSSTLLASFSTTNCSNADGTVKYKYSMQMNAPLVEKWSINGASYNVDAVVVVNIGTEKLLETGGNNMMQVRQYAKKISIKLPNSAMQPIKTWLVCNASKGM